MRQPGDGVWPPCPRHKGEGIFAATPLPANSVVPKAAGCGSCLCSQLQALANPFSAQLLDLPAPTCCWRPLHGFRGEGSMDEMSKKRQEGRKGRKEREQRRLQTP